MFVISLGGVSELVLLGLVERADTLKLKACQRPIIGWNLEYSQYIRNTHHVPSEYRSQKSADGRMATERLG